MDAFTANYGFVNSNLAAIYKVPTPAHEYDRVEFPAEQERSGLLGQATISDPHQQARGHSADVARLVCARAVPVPARAAATARSGYQPSPVLDEARPLTNRERLAVHTTNKTCAGCHSLDRSDRIRPRKVRCNRHVPRKAEAAVLSRSITDGPKKPKPKKCIWIWTPRGKWRALLIRSLPTRGRWASCWRAPGNARNASSSRCFAT